ncbi:helix-turn-helix domain-containing protein [bacterium]|nr:helix-turn-helix domain-containing protein [bacterium]
MGIVATDNFINYYDILEVDPKASSFEVYQAYLKIKKTYSLRDPQMFKNFTFDEIQDLLTMIEEAYATIGNEETRMVYDAQFFKIYPHLKSKIGNMDFSENSPTASFTTPHIVNTEPQPVNVPQGLGKTSLSSYEVDETFEAQIMNQDYFDGVFLGKIRKYKKVKIEDMSQKTCISLKYLYAIEDNNYNALPAPVFTRGYIVQYCKILNIDADKVVTTFMKLYQNGRE